MEIKNFQIPLILYNYYFSNDVLGRYEGFTRLPFFVLKSDY